MQNFTDIILSLNSFFDRIVQIFSSKQSDPLSSKKFTILGTILFFMFSLLATLAIAAPFGQQTTVYFWIISIFALTGSIASIARSIFINRRTTNPRMRAPTSTSIELDSILSAQPFDQRHAELFSSLQRNLELRDLFSHISDNSSSIIVIWGDDGVGKTSFLKAGVLHRLSASNIPTIFLNANFPSDLSNTISALASETSRLPDATSKNKAVQPATKAAAPNAVIIIDDFQLNQSSMRQIRTFFNEYMAQKPNGHRPEVVKLIISMHSASKLEWRKVEDDLDQSIPFIEIRPFNRNQAREVIATLATSCNFPLGQPITDELISDIAEGESVRPADLSMALRLVEELWLSVVDPHEALDLLRRNAAGQGLLSAFISSRIETISFGDSSKILDALWSLCDPETNARRVRGLTADEISAQSPMDLGRLRRVFQLLATSQFNLVEVYEAQNGSSSGQTRFRLISDWVARAVSRLNRQRSLEQQLAYVKFNARFSTWHQSKKLASFLLSRKELGEAERLVRPILSSELEFSKQAFISESRKRLRYRQSIGVGFTIFIGAALYTGYQYLELLRWQHYLESVDLPRDLLHRQEGLVSLHLSRDIGDLRWLRSNSLEELRVESLAFKDLGMLGELPNLRVLEIGQSNITTTDGPPNLVNLAELILGNELSSLRVSSQQVAGVEHATILENSKSIGSPYKLDRPNLARRRFSAIDGLSSFPNLKYLDLSGTDTTSIEFLSYLPALEMLDMTATNLRTVGNMPTAESLTSVSLSHTPIQTLSGISRASNLRYLNLHNASIRVFEDLVELHNLQYLNLSGTNFDDLRLLEGHFSLEYLDLSRSKVYDLRGLDSLHNLKGIWIGDLHLVDVDILSVLPYLTFLSLSKDGGDRSNSDYKVLPGARPLSTSMIPLLSNLRVIDLSGHEISDFQWLEKTSAVERLVLKNSRIPNFVDVPAQNAIRDLDLSGAAIGSFEGFERFENLERLTMDGIRVWDIDSLVSIDSVASLSISKVAWPNNNPLSVDDLSRLVSRFQGVVVLETGSLQDLTNLTSLESLTIGSLTEWSSLSENIGIKFLDASRFRRCLDVPWMFKGASVSPEVTAIWCGGTGYRLSFGVPLVIVQSSTSDTFVEERTPGGEDTIMGAIGALSNLEVVNLDGRFISGDSLIPVGQYLKELDISFTGIENFEFFEFMPVLENLKMHGFEIEDSSIFLPLDNLSELDLRSSRLLEMKNVSENLRMLRM